MFVFVRFGASNGYAGVIGQPGQAPLQLPGHVDSFINNTVYMTSDNAGWGYANVICDPPASMTVIGSNEVYTPTGNVSQCGVPLAQWQAQGHDVGTTVAPASTADVSTFIARARSLLARGPGLASFAAGGA